MNFFISYIKEKGTGLIIFFLFSAIFLCIFSFYRIPAAAVLYPALICLVLGCIFLFFDFRKAYKKHRTLIEIQKLPSELMESFPDANTIAEEDYLSIIKLICDENKHNSTQADIRYADMISYYTLWAHQIKTPIASISLNLQNEDSELSRRISEDLFRIEQYVEMVLMFLRLDSDSTDYVIQEYDLDEIVKSEIKKFAGQFIRRRIRLDYRTLGVPVLTDEKWISFVIEQVLSNALKYTPNGTISIYMEENKTLCIKDSGIGIAPEDLPRIFEKGYTGCNGRSNKKASGIGLYLCKRICNNLGHSISAESKPDTGTIIKIGLEKNKLEIE